MSEAFLMDDWKLLSSSDLTPAFAQLGTGACAQEPQPIHLYQTFYFDTRNNHRDIAYKFEGKRLFDNFE